MWQKLNSFGWTDQAQILCGTSHDPRNGLWAVKIEKKSSSKFFFENTQIRKERFQNIWRWFKMADFQERGREAPYKSCIYIIVQLRLLIHLCLSEIAHQSDPYFNISDIAHQSNPNFKISKIAHQSDPNFKISEIAQIITFCYSSKRSKIGNS